MISRTVIQVEGLGKRYRAGQPARHTALSDLIDDVLRAPVRLLGVSSNHNAGARAHSAGVRPFRCGNCGARFYRLKHSDGSESQDSRAA